MSWGINFVAKNHQAAIDYVADHQAKVPEHFPIESRNCVMAAIRYLPEGPLMVEASGHSTGNYGTFTMNIRSIELRE